MNTGPGRSVEIVRDRAGVPHCSAANEPDAFFAQGWVHAADRLWQLEYDRRRALGRWSEVVGPRGLAIDRFYRQMDLAGFVRRDLDALTPAARAMLDAYADGVNAFIASGARPQEFDVAGVEPMAWHPWHSLLVHRVRHIMMGSARSKLWRAVVASVVGEDAARTMVAGHAEPDVLCVPPGAPVLTHAGADVDGGSNNWVVAGSHTASGKPLLAGDPHRELEAPNVYVQGHVSCPEWDVLGFSIPGVPGFGHFGHNATVAWSITHAMADDQDVCVVPDGAYPVERTETIIVRDGDDETVDIVTTPRGPVVGAGLALDWTATSPSSPNLGFDSLVAMLRARTVGELFETMRDWVEPVNSMLAADVDGNIGYLTRGRVPVRGRDESRYFPVPVDDSSYAWDGWVAFEDLPRCENPSTGFLFSANNTIATSPYIGTDTAAPWRATRIFTRLRSLGDASGSGSASVADMTAIHRDKVSMPAQRFVERVAPMWPVLDGFDGVMDESSTVAGAYSVLRRELLLVVLERSGLADSLKHPYNRLLPGVVPESASWRVVEQHLATGDESLLGGGTWDDVLRESIERAEREWHGETWGELHATLHRHALGVDEFDPPRVEVGGDLDTVFATGYTPTAGFAARAGSVARYCFDVGDWDASGWVVPLGADGSPGGEHAWDQQAAWAAGELLPALYSA